MATAALLSLDQYLATTYRPDCDYIDGELQERTLGKFDHSNLQGELIYYIRSRQTEWNVLGLPEQRIRVSPTRVRIPDVCIISRDGPIEQILTHAPLACIEILSEGDTLRTTQPRLEDYRTFGVQNLWIFDPANREAYLYESGAFRPSTDTLTIAETPISLHLPTLFERL
jgi:Uma2 family endonuclease